MVPLLGGADASGCVLVMAGGALQTGPDSQGSIGLSETWTSFATTHRISVDNNSTDGTTSPAHLSAIFDVTVSLTGTAAGNESAVAPESPLWPAAVAAERAEAGLPAGGHPR